MIPKFMNLNHGVHVVDSYRLAPPFDLTFNILMNTTMPTAIQNWDFTENAKKEKIYIYSKISLQFWDCSTYLATSLLELVR
jgi:hypothetical protein